MIEEYRERLAEEYEYYTENISKLGYPISLELSSYIYWLCDTNKFKTVMDRGSGFSSYIFRRYASEQDFDVTVFSIDTDKQWLERTRKYLKRNNLKTDRLFLWDDFYNRDGRRKGTIDFVLEDATYQLRTTTYTQMIEMLSPEGSVIFDDGHYKTHRQIRDKVAEKYKFITHDISHLTTDSFTRYGMLITKNENLKI